MAQNQTYNVIHSNLVRIRDRRLLDHDPASARERYVCIDHACAAPRREPPPSPSRSDAAHAAAAEGIRRRGRSDHLLLQLRAVVEDDEERVRIELR